MGTVDLLTICLVAFVAVFVILSSLALIMRGIVALFPVRQSAGDTSVYAAITTTYQTQYPGTIVTRIEEIK